MSYSALPGLTFNDPGSTLLGILYGKPQGGSGIDPVSALQRALDTRTKGIAAAAAEPLAKREIAAFRAAVAKAPDVKTLLADPVARKVLLTANGLGSQSAYGVLATKALLSDTSKPGSLASQLADTRWLDLAKSLDFANKGLSALKDPQAVDTIANAYAEVSWRTGLDSSTPGLSNAIDFRSRAATITAADQVLGDPVFRTVITTALSIPQQIAFQNLPAQEKAITDRVDLTRFKSPAFVDQFTRRYLIQAGIAAGASGQSTGLLV